MKILFVDDEPGAAMRLAEGVAAAGVGECFFAQSAEEAVGIASREGAVDLLVAEVFAVPVDGFTLRETLQEHFPALRTIFLAGEELEDVAERAGAWPVLAKPVDAAALADFIRDFCAPSGEETVSDPLVGAMLGGYRIDAWLGADSDGNFYRAVQTSIERPAELHVLSPERASDPAEVARFLADTRAKANVYHPALFSLFEAGHQDGLYFYTSEPRSGRSVAEMLAKGDRLEARAVIQILHAISEVMVHLGHEKISHEPLAAGHVIVDPRMRARLVNTASAAPAGLGFVPEIQMFSRMLSPLLIDSESSAPVRRRLFEMESESITLRSWNALLYEVKRCAAGAGSPDAHGLDPSGRAAIAAVGTARRRHRRLRRAVTTLVGLLVLGGGGFLAWKLLNSETSLPRAVEVAPK